MSDHVLDRRPSLWLLLRAILGYSFYFASSFAFIGALPPLLLFLGWNRSWRQWFIEEMFRLFSYFLSRVYLPFLGIYRVVEESGFEHTSPSQPAVIVANHRSRMDAPFLLPVLKKTGVVIKSNYARRPFYAALVKHLNFISVDPSSLNSLTESMKQCKALLHNGTRLLVFPEGTRAGGNRMGEFKDLAFRMAIDADVPVIPVVLHTTLPFMTKVRGSIFPPHRFSVTIRMLPPVHRTAGERAGEYAARVRKLIEEHLRELDKGTVWETLGSAADTSRKLRTANGIAAATPLSSPAKDIS